jgi:aliphatic nitrilase
MAITNLDFSLITKRKRMMDSVGHYSRPELLQLQLNQNASSVMQRGEKELGQPLQMPEQQILQTALDPALPILTPDV